MDGLKTSPTGRDKRTTRIPLGLIGQELRQKGLAITGVISAILTTVAFVTDIVVGNRNR
jgi:hypothetical protein